MKYQYADINLISGYTFLSCLYLISYCATGVAFNMHPVLLQQWIKA